MKNNDDSTCSPRVKLKPSTAFLIILNALIILGLCTIGGNIVGLFVGVATFIFLMIPSSIIHGLIYAVIRKKKLNTFLRSLLYLSPAILLIGFSVFAPKLPQKPNQKTPLMSPSESYILTVPIKAGVWNVTISDTDGNVLYEDNSDFLGHFNVYWYWDAEDRVWLYNSDDGRVYFWENVKGKWLKEKWGYGHTKEIERNIYPPEQMYPHYATPSYKQKDANEVIEAWKNLGMYLPDDKDVAYIRSNLPGSLEGLKKGLVHKDSHIRVWRQL